MRLRDLGYRRIAYLDLDAHHGDGVETAFATNSDVLTISVHEAGRWPRTGLAHDPANAVYNFAVPPGFHDAELAFLVQAAIRPAIEKFAPEILLVLPGADALEADKMSKLSLSNNAIWDPLRAVRGLAPRLAVFGGGGYNPYVLARCWAGIWAILNDLSLPEALPEAAREMLRGIRHFRHAAGDAPAWQLELRDAPSRAWCAMW